MKWSDTLEAVLMQLWPRSGADRLPEANDDNKIGRVSEIFFIMRMQCGRDEKQKKIVPGL